MAENKIIKYNSVDLWFGRLMYMINDPDQDAYELVGIILRKGHVKYLLNDPVCNVEFEVWQYQVSTEINELKRLNEGGKRKEEDDEDGDD